MFNTFVRGVSGASAPETDVAQAAQAQAGGPAQIVDVREPDEWAEGHIPGALLIPLGELTARLQEMDRTQPVITVCRGGNRSLVAAATLTGEASSKSRAWPVECEPGPRPVSR